MHTTDAATRDELERWLCGPDTPIPTRDVIASVFGLAFDAPTIADAGPSPLQLRFTLTVLLDTFPTDGAVRRWLCEPVATLGGRRPLDLLRDGRVGMLEELAVDEWNRGSAA